MAECTFATKRGFILYDDALTSHAGAELFSPLHWARQTSLRDATGGRGNTWIVVGDNDEWVLRHYRRGGVVRHFNRDRYLWRGLEYTRPWREWRLLSYLYKKGLPVPQPVAVQVLRYGPAYRGDLITRLIPDAHSLAAQLRQGESECLPWERVGTCIRRFHDAGVYHADLNAHNILVNGDGQIYLIDFDAGELRKTKASWQQANLRRLSRSLRKLAVPSTAEDHVWSKLMRGYNNLG
jgi:3-deoxy-D-manno-octulosonic acid kinase